MSKGLSMLVTRSEAVVGGVLSLHSNSVNKKIHSKWKCYKNSHCFISISSPSAHKENAGVIDSWSCNGNVSAIFPL